MDMKQRIEQKLQTVLAPSFLDVQNQSHLHAGHAGDDGSGESHFHVEITAEQFYDIPRVARERLIFDALKDEMPLIHALSTKIILP